MPDPTRSQIQKLQRENEILRAALAAAMFQRGSTPSPNSTAFTRKVARFLLNPEFRPLRVTVREARPVFVRALEVTMETEITLSIQK